MLLRLSGIGAITRRSAQAGLVGIGKISTLERVQVGGEEEIVVSHCSFRVVVTVSKTLDLFGFGM